MAVLDLEKEGKAMFQNRFTPEQIIPKLRTFEDVDGFRMLGTTRFLNVPFGARKIADPGALQRCGNV